MEELGHAISGGVSALISTSFLHPLESLRTRMQALTESTTIKKLVNQILKEEGVKGLYSGFKSALISAITSYGVYFWAYRLLQKLILKNKLNLTVIDHTLVSIFASWTTILVNTPIWVINTRHMKGQGQGIYNSFKSIIQNEGIRGLYSGLVPSLILSANPVIQFVLYEVLKGKMGQRYSSALFFFIIGAISKLVASICTYPMLTMKTRLQLEEGKNLGIGQLIKQTLEHEGIAGMYRGLSSKLIQTISNTAILMAIHEKLSLIIVRLLSPPARQLS